MMGRQTVDQSQLFYLFNLEKRIPNATSFAASIRLWVGYWLSSGKSLRLSTARSGGHRSPRADDPMLIVGYRYGVRFGGGFARRSNCISPIAG